MGRSFRLAVGQSPAALSSPQERLDWLTEALPAVSSESADLLLLPELFATGYNIGSQITARSERADGPTAQVIAALAKSHGVAIHYGFVEEDEEKIFNSAQCFGPDGKRLGNHRKLVIPPGFVIGNVILPTLGEVNFPTFVVGVKFCCRATCPGGHAPRDRSAV